MGSLFTIYKDFGDFFKCIFTSLLQIQHENSFLPTSKHRQAKARRFFGFCLYDCFIYRSNFVFRKFLETRPHLGSGRKTVNSQGYSELWETIKTRENCYSLIWKILKHHITGLKTLTGRRQQAGYLQAWPRIWPRNHVYHLHQSVPFTKNGRESLKLVSKMALNKTGTRISVRYIPTGKQDYLFRRAIASGDFPLKRPEKSCNTHLLSNKNFRKRL